MSSRRAPAAVVVGVIADTHGELGEAAVRALSGCARIIHAGDVVDDETLPALRRICPVTAVRGNMDRAGGVAGLPRAAALEIAGTAFYALHDVSCLDLDPGAAGFDVVVHGHTHRPEIELRGSVLYVNPGSASRPRGSPASVALIELGPAGPIARIVVLE
jgi:putative phosphoesterase